ncbi:MAG: hypothetical protein GF313_04705 [Caldithrix sp.]|nr:hypothetical protein [Caldithrix sp.]
MIPLLFTPIAYAEIHYRIKFLFNLLKKSEPEIIADIPHRITKGQDLPVLMVIKDSHLYNTNIEKLEIYLNGQYNCEFEIRKFYDTPYADQVFDLPTNKMSTGINKFDIKIHYSLRGKKHICYNDNYRFHSGKPLLCYVAHQTLPGFPQYFFGDFHVHTNYTNDQIEFGASISSTVKMAKAVGLHSFAVTDHSYDLDDHPNDYTQYDASLTKWKTQHKEIDQINAEQKKNFILLLPGEEVSVRNDAGKTVHLLILNNEQFYHGSGDSGDQWRPHASEFKIEEILQHLKPHVTAFAAHPRQKVSKVQKLMLRRGNWQKDDLRHERLRGLQIINGNTVAGLNQAIAFWTEALLQGHKLSIIAGNDAHGNFSRTRQMGIPFVTIEETEEHRFGFWRTGFYLHNPSPTINDVVQALQQGNVFVTNGPAISIYLTHKGHTVHMGQTATQVERLILNLKSSMEFGRIKRWKILSGDPHTAREFVLFEGEPNQKKFVLRQSFELDLNNRINYVRGFLISENERGTFRAYTNPIWIDHLIKK